MLRISMLLLMALVSNVLLAQRENLGLKVNSTVSEFAPVISPDGRMLYYSRATGKTGDSDVWFSKLDGTNNWTEKSMLGPEINNDSYNAVCGVTADNNQLLLFGDYSKSGKQFSTSHKNDKAWTNPKPIQFESPLILSKGSFYGNISSDGRVLILELKKDKGLGSNDLYVSFKKTKDLWTDPVNMGPVINSVFWEMTPCLAPDMKTLYFSSDRPGGFGEPDVYLSRRLDDTWLKWSTPKNLGKDVNTKGWDYYYFVPASGEYAYYSSEDGVTGNTDIFRVKLPSDLKPAPTVLVTGQVLNKETNRPLAANITYESLSKPGSSVVFTTDPQDGTYTLVLPQGELYGFYASLDGFFPVSENIDLKSLKKYGTIKKTLYLNPIKKGETLTLNNLFFDTGKSIIKSESHKELNRLIKLLNDNKDLEIEIIGHTDNIGSENQNLILSKERAEKVKKFLLDKKIPAKRISSTGFGQSKPIASNDNEVGRKQNRRVEIKIK